MVDVRLGKLHETHYKKETRPTLDELKDPLSNVLPQYDKTFVVLDALDEVLNEKSRSDLVDCLRTFKQKSKLLITSRPVSAIEQLSVSISKQAPCDGCYKKEMKVHWHCTGCSGTVYNVSQDCTDQSIFRILATF